MSQHATPEYSEGASAPDTPQRPLVTFLDPLSWDHGWEYSIEASAMAAHGVDLVIPGDPSERDELLRRADIVVSSSIVPVTADLIAGWPRCVGIVCYSAGRDAVDETAAQAAGIDVRSLHANATEVADHAMALLLAAERLIVPMTQTAAAGQWDLISTPQIWEMRRLEELVLGIVGVGHAGRAVAKRARGFGYDVIGTYHRPPATPEPGQVPHVPLDELFRQSDAVVICASLTDDSHGMINGDVLAGAKPGMILVNVGRGPIIDEGALVDALDAGTIRTAALDVRESEPPDPATDRLTGRPDVIQTPHIAGVSGGVRRELQTAAAATMVALLRKAGRLPDDLST